MRASESRRSTQTDALRQRRFWTHFARSLVLVAAALAMGLGAGCSSNSEACGGVMIEGKCQKRCQDSACAAGTRCVVDGSLNNACEPSCKAQSDCPVGKNCVKYLFPDKTTDTICVRLPYTKGGRTGQQEACQVTSECDTKRGFKCLDKTCQQICEKSSDCPSDFVCNEFNSVDENGNTSHACVPNGTAKEGENCASSASCDQRSGLRCYGGVCGFPCKSSDDCVGGHCTASTDDNGQPADACVKDQDPHDKGQYGTHCPNGSADCDAANGFACVGVAGALDSYCTQRDCKTNNDCATGYFCSLQRTATVPCQDACGFTGDPGATGCAQASDIGAGKTFQCGPFTLLRHICLKREFCNECETDADCLAEPNQICAKDKGGNKICTVLCDPKTNSCPWGTAATCGVWDQDLGKATCAHRYGSCKGKANGCDPCIDDNDCGSNGLCLTSDFTGEHFCLELGDSCSCPAGTSQLCDGGGCPPSPGGIPMTCIGGSQYKSSDLYNKCYGANSSNDPFGTPQTGCWPPQH